MTTKTTNNMTMKEINIAEAKAKLSRLIDQLLTGEEDLIVLCRRNVAVAELRPVRRTRKKPRPFGFARGEFEIPDSFFEPLPDDLLDAFEGRGSEE